MQTLLIIAAVAALASAIATYVAAERYFFKPATLDDCLEEGMMDMPEVKIELSGGGRTRYELDNGYMRIVYTNEMYGGERAETIQLSLLSRQGLLGFTFINGEGSEWWYEASDTETKYLDAKRQAEAFSVLTVVRKAVENWNARFEWA